MKFESDELYNGRSISICDSKCNEIFQADISAEGEISNILVYEYDDFDRAIGWMILDGSGTLKRSFKCSYKGGKEEAIEEFGSEGGLLRKTEFERDSTGFITKEIYYNGENKFKGYGVFVYKEGEYHHTVYYDFDGRIVDKPMA